MHTLDMSVKPQSITKHAESNVEHIYYLLTEVLFKRIRHVVFDGIPSMSGSRHTGFPMFNSKLKSISWKHHGWDTYENPYEKERSMIQLHMGALRMKNPRPHNLMYLILDDATLMITLSSRTYRDNSFNINSVKLFPGKHLVNLVKVSLKNTKYVLYCTRTRKTDWENTAPLIEPTKYPLPQNMLLEFVRNRTCKSTLKYFGSDLTTTNKANLQKERPNLILR